MKNRTSKLFLTGMIVFFLCSFVGNTLYAQPTSPPPPGKVWVKTASGWVLVPSPPADAPYVWVVDHWEKITEIPPGKVWVPPHWGDNGWIPGHWRAVVYPYKGARWKPGHWTLDGHWIPGHWGAAVRPYPHKRKHLWVPGHHGPHGRWIPGHWR